MDMFENKIIEGIHVSRFAVSWAREGGQLSSRGAWRFKEWLRTLVINGRKLTDEEVNYIYNFGTNGKMELEHSAYEYLKNE